MPNPYVYLAAVATAALVSAVVLWSAKRLRLPLSAACVGAMAAGTFVGAWLLKLPLHWPPTIGLGRVLILLLPAAVATELLAGLTVAPRWLGWMCRLALAFAATRIVLHGSVYIAGDRPQWSAPYAALVLLASGALLYLVWTLLIMLARRPGGVSLPLALGETAFCGGLAVMLKGYLSGGEAALPLVGALVGYSLASALLKLPKDDGVGAIGIAVVLLFGLLFVGRFFGQLSTVRLLAIFLAPLVCWVSELSAFRQRAAWQIGAVRLALVAVPLVLVVLLAKGEFERDTLPLISVNSQSKAISLGDYTARGLE